MFLLNYIKGINCTNKKLKRQANSSRMHFYVLEIINFALVRADTKLILCLHLLFCIPYCLPRSPELKTLPLSVYPISTKNQINLFVACCYLKLHWHSKRIYWVQKGMKAQLLPLLNTSSAPDLYIRTVWAVTSFQLKWYGKIQIVKSRTAVIKIGKKYKASNWSLPCLQ